MLNLDSEKVENTVFTDFIKEITPGLNEFKTFTGRKPASDEYILEVPNQLRNQNEARLMQTAFTYLFYLNAARETRAPFDIDSLPAMEGNRLIKKQHPLNIKYDFQFVAAKTRMTQYVNAEPFTVPYNRMATQIFGACFLFAQLEQVAQTGIVPEKLEAAFYFLPKGSFIEEFEAMNELALTEFMPQLMTQDDVLFHSKNLMINDRLIKIDTSEMAEDKESEVAELIRFFFLQKVKERFGSAPPLHPFKKTGFYRARFGELELLDVEEFYGDKLDGFVEKAYRLLQ